MTSDLPLSKEQILDAAEQVLRRYGPDKASVVDVARMLEVSHGTLYRHFASKAELAKAVTERWLQRSIVDPLEKIAGRSEESSFAQLRLWMDTLVNSKQNFSATDPELFSMVAAVTLRAADVIRWHINCLLQQLTKIIECGIRSNEFVAGEPEVMAKAILYATVKFHHPMHAHEWKDEGIHDEFVYVWDLLMAGMTKQGKSTD